MKIVIDDKIPYIKGVLEPYSQVHYVPGAKIGKTIVKDADALIIRTRTVCNEELLNGSKIKFIATATIGHDHIDKAYCRSNGIEWVNAPGCNSASVEQYISSALLNLAKDYQMSLHEKTLGIIGVGNVGSKVKKSARLFGMNVLLNDPPRQRNEGNGMFVELDDLMERSDIITLHVPLNREGEDKTFHLFNETRFAAMKAGQFLVNSSRGEVVDNDALKKALRNKEIAGAVLDVWENEPQIDEALLKMVVYGTPHIAGYSKDGKANGTAQAVNAVSRFFGLPQDDWYPVNIPVPDNTKISVDCRGKSLQEVLFDVINFTYDIKNDSKRLAQSPQNFEEQRGSYPLRREYGSFRVELKHRDEKVAGVLNELGFAVY
jgi:erythronate-4-phosphate dehydrogenase